MWVVPLLELKHRTILVKNKVAGYTIGTAQRILDLVWQYMCKVCESS
ncbi:unnamed protein product, partial [Vitis vinifera]